MGDYVEMSGRTGRRHSNTKNSIAVEGSLYRPARAWSVALMLALMTLVSYLDKVVVGMVSVPMMRELHLSPAQFGLVGGSVSWLLSVSAILGGFAANRISTKWLLLLMAIVWSVLQLPMMVAGSIWVVIACRVLLGASNGPADPVAIHALYKWFPDEKRNLAVAAIHQGGALALLVAGLTIPVITAHWGWRANFLALAVLGAVWCVGWAIFGAEGQLSDPAHASNKERIPYSILLTDRTILGNLLGHFSANWVLGMTMTWLPTYLQLGLGYGAHAAGRMFALFIVTATPLSLGLAWVSQHLLSRGASSRAARGLFVSITLAMAGALFTTLVYPGLTTLEKFTLLTLAGSMTLVLYSIGPAILGEVTPVSQRGGILALISGLASLAGLVAPTMTGMLIQKAGGSTAHGFEQACFVTGFVLLGCGAVCAVCLDPQRSKSRLMRHTYR